MGINNKVQQLCKEAKGFRKELLAKVWGSGIKANVFLYSIAKDAKDRKNILTSFNYFLHKDNIKKNVPATCKICNMTREKIFRGNMYNKGGILLWICHKHQQTLENTFLLAFWKIIFYCRPS